MTTVGDNELTTEEWLVIKEADLRIDYAKALLGAAAVARADGKATLTGVGA
jgi:hypothetical protein